MVRENNSRVPHGNHDQNIQSVELSYENTLGHQALVLRSIQTNSPRAEGYVFHRFSIELYGENSRHYQTVGKVGSKRQQAQQIV